METCSSTIRSHPITNLNFLYSKLFPIICLFVWFDSLRPINNLSGIKGRVFLGWTSTKLGLMFLLKDTMHFLGWTSTKQRKTVLLKDTTECLQWFSNKPPLNQVYYSTLSHRAPLQEWMLTNKPKENLHALHRLWLCRRMSSTQFNPQYW